MQKSNNTLLIVLVSIIALCCCAVIILGGLFVASAEFLKYLPSIKPSLTYGITPTFFDITFVPLESDIFSTLKSLEETIIPERDLVSLACRFDNICDVSDTISPPSTPYMAGSQRNFWLNNSDTGIYTQITATLQYLTAHAYFWVENGISFNRREAENLINTFEEEIYPTNRMFFGSEWTPGVDNDPHIYIIYASNLGTYVAGYFISLDEYNPLIVEYSNSIEGFYIDSSQDLGSEFTYGTLAHEFQHMIHWYQDTNESSFLDEGFSELASFLNEYDPGGFDWFYTSNPDINLTDWQETEENSAHYGANFLFVTYFLDRFGDVATQALIHDQQNELESVDNILQQLELSDLLTGLPISADDFFLDWVIANYVHDETVSDGRYFYHNYPSSPTTSDTDLISTCPVTDITRTVNQYGVDYIRITCPGDYVLDFFGSTTIPLLPTDFHSGEFGFWSNKANESNTSLQRQFDFTGVSDSLTLTFWTWFDLESTYDYVYLEASTDGETWEILITPSGTADNPTGSSYGWAYTGDSGGWIKETIDLSRYAGEMVTLRFDYITDAAVVNRGFLLDDISIPEIGYFEDFESLDESWEAAGFIRIKNLLPQTYRLALIHHTGSDTSIEIVPFDGSSFLEIPIDISSGDDVVLVVTATTRFTLESAQYQIDIR